MFTSYTFSIKYRWFVSLFNNIEVMSSKIVSPTFIYATESIKIVIMVYPSQLLPPICLSDLFSNPIMGKKRKVVLQLFQFSLTQLSIAKNISSRPTFTCPKSTIKVLEKMWNMFQVNNKKTRKTSKFIVNLMILLTLKIFYTVF